MIECIAHSLRLQYSTIKQILVVHIHDEIHRMRCSFSFVTLNSFHCSTTKYFAPGALTIAHSQ